MFENLVMQAVNGTGTGISTGNAQIDSIVAIVLAIGSIATVIGHFISSNSKFKNYGQYLTTFGQKTVEQEKNLSAIGSAMVGVSPEAAAELAKYGAQLEELRRRAQVAEAQLRALQPKIPDSAQADNKTDLPR